MSSVVRKLIMFALGAAIGSTIVILGIAEVADAIGDRYAKHAAQAEERSRRIEAYHNCHLLAGFEKLYCEDQAAIHARDRQREETQYAADHKSAVWSKAQGIAAVVGVVFSVVTILAVFLTYTQQQRANKIALFNYRDARRRAREALAHSKETLTDTRRIGEAQTRCYLTGVSAELSVIDAGAVMVKCLIKNSGQSPARGVQCSGGVSYSVAEGEHRVLIKAFEAQVPGRVDIAARGEEWGTFYIEGMMEDWATTGAAFSVSVNAKIVGKDVFDKPVAESEWFAAHPPQKPQVNAWLKMNRVPHYHP